MTASDEDKGAGKDNQSTMSPTRSSRASTSICSARQDMDAVILKHNIDSAFITHMEQLRDDTEIPAY